MEIIYIKQNRILHTSTSDSQTHHIKNLADENNDEQIQLKMIREIKTMS